MKPLFERYLRHAEDRANDSNRNHHGANQIRCAGSRRRAVFVTRHDYQQTKTDDVYTSVTSAAGPFQAPCPSTQNTVGHPGLSVPVRLRMNTSVWPGKPNCCEAAMKSPSKAIPA